MNIFAGGSNGTGVHPPFSEGLEDRVGDRESGDAEEGCSCGSTISGVSLEVEIRG